MGMLASSPGDFTIEADDSDTIERDIACCSGEARSTPRISGREAGIIHRCQWTIHIVVAVDG